jgi:hypothetical protein
MFNSVYITSTGESPKRMNADVMFYFICPVALLTGINKFMPMYYFMGGSYWRQEGNRESLRGN